MMNEPLSSIMSTDLITAGPEDSLSKIREFMKTNRIHHIPVVDDSRLVGILTTYDLFKLEFTKKESRAILVKDIMTTKLATLEPHEKIGAAAEVLLEHLFHAVPIVNEKKELVGIVTSFDILKYQYFKEYPSEAEYKLKD